MKIRNGFVSNSSSSSFTCEVCGEMASGMDISHGADIWDCTSGMFQCENDHTVCKEHAVSVHRDEFDQVIYQQFNDPEDEDSIYEVYDRIPARYCPICQMQAIRDKDMLAWCLKRLYMPRDTAEQQIKDSFHTYDAFMEGVRTKKLKKVDK